MYKSVLFELPGTHPSLNTWTRMHRFVKNKEAHRWYENIHIMWLSLKKPVFKGKVKVHVVYHMTTLRRRDYDNYVPKFIMDGLKECFIVDDNMRIVKAPSWEVVVDKSIKKPYTRVIITEESDETPEVYF